MAGLPTKPGKHLLGWKQGQGNGAFKKESGREFPGGPVVKTPHFHCRAHGLDPWWGN